MPDLLKGNALYVFFALALALLVFGGAFWYRQKRHLQVTPIREVAGSRIRLAIGERFAPSDRFTGFVDEQSGASVVLVELPVAAFDQLQNLEYAAQTFLSQGVSDIQRQYLPTRTDAYIYLQGAQKTALVDYIKYILVFKDNALTAMITVNVPRVALTSGLVTGAEIEAMLHSAQIGAAAQDPKPLFTLDYLGPFQEDISLLGTTKGYRLKDENSYAKSSGINPLFLVAPSLAQAPIPDLTRFAERTFNGIDQVKDKFVEETKLLKVAGLEAVEILGGGIDGTSSKPAFVYQLIVEAPHGGYFRLLGLAPELYKSTLLPEYKKIAHSFRLP